MRPPLLSPLSLRLPMMQCRRSPVLPHHFLLPSLLSLFPLFFAGAALTIPLIHQQSARLLCCFFIHTFLNRVLHIHSCSSEQAQAVLKLEYYFLTIVFAAAILFGLYSIRKEATVTRIVLLGTWIDMYSTGFEICLYQRCISIDPDSDGHWPIFLFLF